MDTSDILRLLKPYGIASYEKCREIDTSLGDDFRLNLIIDRKYVLRINNDVITEERLASIDRLCGRYRAIGVQTPRLYQNTDGRYLTPWENHVCYLSEYIDCPTGDTLGGAFERSPARDEVLCSIGRLCAKYSDLDLSPVNSMWSLIDLAPLDTDVDEKQENLDTLVNALREAEDPGLAEQVERFNQEKRAKIKAVYKRLPRCVIQGDLNRSNILVKDGHFFGLIDFNMAGTEVNVNHFCCETNGYLDETDFMEKQAEALYEQWTAAQKRGLDLILSEYTMNELERSALADYRAIGRISQYPNVMAYLRFLEQDHKKAVRLIELVLGNL